MHGSDSTIVGQPGPTERKRAKPPRSKPLTKDDRERLVLAALQILVSESDRYRVATKLIALSRSMPPVGQEITRRVANDIVDDAFVRMRNAPQKDAGEYAALVRHRGEMLWREVWERGNRKDDPFAHKYLNIAQRIHHDQMALVQREAATAPRTEPLTEVRFTIYDPAGPDNPDPAGGQTPDEQHPDGQSAGQPQ